MKDRNTIYLNKQKTVLGVDKTWTPFWTPLWTPFRTPFWTPFWTPLLDPLLDPSIFSVKKKIVIHNAYATYHRFVCSLVSFSSAFISKEGVPSMPRISQLSFSIPERNQELFTNHLLG